MHRRESSATLWQLAFPGESNPNFQWEKSQYDKRVLKKGFPHTMSLGFQTTQAFTHTHTRCLWVLNDTNVHTHTRDVYGGSNDTSIHTHTMSMGFQTTQAFTHTHDVYRFQTTQAFTHTRCLWGFKRHKHSHTRNSRTGTSVLHDPIRALS